MPSSSEIKQWLVVQLHAQGTPTLEKEWKQARKHKDDQGRWRRVFRHPTLGEVAVIETSKGLEMEAPGANPPFSRPSWSSTQIQAADRLMNALRHGHLEPEEAPIHPDYLVAHDCLPSHFSFCFPPDTYGNEGQKGRTLKDGFAELCIRVDDAKLKGPAVYIADVIRDRLEAIGFNPTDEAHWELGLEGMDQSIEEMVRRLLALGLVYNPDECMLAPQLTAGGATNPQVIERPQNEECVATPSRSDRQALRRAIRDDDAQATQAVLTRHPPEAWGDMVRGRSWVKEAYEARAWEALEALLCYGVRTQSPCDRDRLADDKMGPLWRKSPGKAKSLLRALVLSPGWDSEQPWNRFDITQGHRARDEWAALAWHDQAAGEDSWLEVAWDLLQGRIGQALADESFVHAWCMRAFSSRSDRAIPARVVKALKRCTTLLDTWPKRGEPRPWQALLQWGTSSSAHASLLEVGRLMGVDLPNLGPIDGQPTLLDWARQRQEEAHRSMEGARRGHGGFSIVITDRYGRTASEYEYRKSRWIRAVEFQRALSQWSDYRENRPD